MTHAEWRLIAALAASALLHAWLMQAAPGVRVLRTNAAHPQISVVLSAPVDWLSPADEVQTRVITPGETTVTAATTPVVKPTATITEPVATAPTAEQRALPQPSDPNYYLAASLDVYPKAQGSLDLTARAGIGQRGEIRATVLIDEAGVVNEVRELRSTQSNTEAESAAREVLLSTRFTPARKDGRIVKAQVLVSLQYGSPAP